MENNTYYNSQLAASHFPFEPRYIIQSNIISLPYTEAHSILSKYRRVFVISLNGIYADTHEKKIPEQLGDTYLHLLNSNLQSKSNSMNKHAFELFVKKWWNLYTKSAIVKSYEYKHVNTRIVECNESIIEIKSKRRIITSAKTIENITTNPSNHNCFCTIS